MRENTTKGGHLVVLAVIASSVVTVQGAISEARRAECAKRAEALVRQMSGEERVAQLIKDAPSIRRLGVGGYAWWNEALHGYARAGLATVFPQSIGAAATFDVALERKVAEAISTEARAKCNLFRAKGQTGMYQGLTLWSPNVNMFRDPRWGRGQETFGEDPYLTGEMGVAFVEGIQGDDPKYLKAAACAKHFAAHSAPEAIRLSFNSKVSERDLREYYLPAFRKLAIEGRVESFMGAYNALNGVPCCANRYLLTDILRGEWGFRGHVVSDVGAVQGIYQSHRYETNDVAGCKAAIAAGLDLCSEDTYRCLKQALKDGRLSEEELVAPLVRLFTTRMLLGHFDPAGSTPWDSLGADDVATPAHRALALEMAEKSLVLVSNKNGTLPLDRNRIGQLGVIGPRAYDEEAMYGNYNGYPGEAVSCVTGIMREAGPGVKATAEHFNVMCHTDTIVACVGLTAREEAEHDDRKQYAIPQAQMALLEELRVKRPKARIVAVVFGGSPVDLGRIVELCDATLLAWYPGEQGGRAVGRVLFGTTNPSGRLPITFPKSWDDLPPLEDYSVVGRTYRYATKSPAYPFGFGLSYTTFAYSCLCVDGLNVSVRVKNVGKRAGDEIVQLYLRAPQGSGDRRVHHLEGFRRVTLAPGEEKTVGFALKREQLEVFGEDGKPLVPNDQTTVFVGGGQPGFAKCLSAEISVGN